MSIFSQTWGRALVVAGGLVLGGRAAAAAVPPGVVFHASFEQSVDAEGAGGPLKPASVKDVKFIKGLKGEAVVLGKQALVYPAGAKTPMEAGTISMWVKPITWSGRSDEFVYFFSAGFPDKSAHLQLYKYIGGAKGLGILFLAGRTVVEHEKRQWVYANHRAGDWLQNQWRMLTATWSQGNELLTLYENGQPVASAKMAGALFPKQAPVDFVLNAPAGHQDPNRQTALDEVYLFNRALSEAEVRALYDSYEKPAAPAPRLPTDLVPPSVMSVPHVSHPPTIDGTFSEQEWSRAGKAVGLSRIGVPGASADHFGEVRAAYDDQYLYVLMRTPLPQGRKLKGEAQGIDNTALFKDDAIEMLLAPGADRSHYYQFAANPGGARYDNQQGDVKWNSNWQVAHSTYEGWWITEARVPFAAMGVKTPRRGEKWGANFCRDWAEADGALFTSWSFTPGAYFKPLGEIVFAGDGPFAQLDLDTEALRQRQLSGRVTVSNPGSKGASLELEVSGTDAAGTVLFQSRKSLSVPGGGALSEPLSEALGQAPAMAVRVRLLDGAKAVWFDHTLPLNFPRGMVVHIQRDRMHKAVSVSADFPGLQVPKETKLTASIGLFQGEQPVLQSPMTVAANRQQVSATLRCDGVRPGDYTMRISLRDAAGKVLIDRQQPFTYVGDPAWLRSKTGETSAVLWPWTPMSVEGTAVSCWGRTYQFEDGPVPAQITAQGRALLASAMKLNIEAGGQKVRWMPAKVTQAGDEKVILSASGSAGPLNVEATVRVEYDGLALVELRLIPPAGGAEVNGLSLSVPFAPGVAELVNAHNFGHNSVRGLVKDHALGMFLPCVWIGDGRGGVTWFTESDQYWQHKDPEHVLEIAGPDQAGGRTLKVNMIDTPERLERPITLRFGLQATPVKPIPPDFRQIRTDPSPHATLGHPWNLDHSLKKYNMTDPRWGFLSPQIGDYGKLKQEMEKWRAKGINMPVYIAPCIVSPDAPEYQAFRDQWRNPHAPYTFACSASSFTDFTMYLVDRMVREGEVRSIYVDCGDAYACGNREHGCGYVRPDGSVALTYPILAMRDYLKRLYALLHATDTPGHRAILWVHCSGALATPYLSFVDIQLEGEEMQYRIARTPSYFDLYPPEVFRSVYGHQSGIISMLLPNYGRVGSEADRRSPARNATFMTLVLLNDAQLWNLWDDVGWVNGIYKKLDAFGIRQTDVVFEPYWAQKAVTAKAGEGSEVLISVYRRPGKALAVVGNAGKAPREVQLNINPGALGFEPGTIPRLSELIEGHSVDAAAPALSIPAENFRLLLIEAK